MSTEEWKETAIRVAGRPVKGKAPSEHPNRSCPTSMRRPWWANADVAEYAR
jgi:hypothetical protein